MYIYIHVRLNHFAGILRGRILVSLLQMLTSRQRKLHTCRQAEAGSLGSSNIYLQQFPCLDQPLSSYTFIYSCIHSINTECLLYPRVSSRTENTAMKERQGLSSHGAYILWERGRHLKCKQ